MPCKDLLTDDCKFVCRDCIPKLSFLLHYPSILIRANINARPPPATANTTTERTVTTNEQAGDQQPKVYLLCYDVNSSLPELQDCSNASSSFVKWRECIPYWRFHGWTLSVLWLFDEVPRQPCPMDHNQRNECWCWQARTTSVCMYQLTMMVMVQSWRGDKRRAELSPRSV